MNGTTDSYVCKIVCMRVRARVFGPVSRHMHADPASLVQTLATVCNELRAMRAGRTRFPRPHDCVCAARALGVRCEHNEREASKP